MLFIMVILPPLGVGRSNRGVWPTQAASALDSGSGLVAGLHTHFEEFSDANSFACVHACMYACKFEKNV